MPYSSHVFIDGFSRSSTICISDCCSQDCNFWMTIHSSGSKSIIATPHTVFFDDMVARILNQMLIVLMYYQVWFQDLLLTTSYTHFCDNFQDNKKMRW
ncbi:unnamed protein product [Brassica oleracea var. botrytis]